MNPQKAELVKDPREWLYSGAVIPGYPRQNVFAEDYWPKFWKLYGAAMEPEARLRRLPADRIKGVQRAGGDEK